MLNELSQQILKINKANGWDVAKVGDWENPDKISSKLCLVHSEVSEALEEVRQDDFASFSEELADIIIRVLDLSAGLQIDIDSLILQKLEKNKNRGHKHGGKRI
jgi:NTP pyrophosphatase (non-canonical NTP hydrolase)